jgi:hypothetical protein
VTLKLIASFNGRVGTKFIRDPSKFAFERKYFFGFFLNLGYWEDKTFDISRCRYDTNMSLPDANLAIKSMSISVPNANLTIESVSVPGSKLTNIRLVAHSDTILAR